MGIALTLHMLAAVIWVGGMFFAYMALRPAAATILEPADRLPLWRATFARFFPWVWLSVGIILITGFGMSFAMFGDLSNAPTYLYIMIGLGMTMILLYMHLFFSPYRRLEIALKEDDLAKAGKCLDQIRKLIAINLPLGLIVIAVAVSGKYMT